MSLIGSNLPRQGLGWTRLFHRQPRRSPITAGGIILDGFRSSANTGGFSSAPDPKISDQLSMNGIIECHKSVMVLVQIAGKRIKTNQTAGQLKG